jgi:hypothetical protein
MSNDSICGFLIARKSRYPDFMAFLGVPHPSAHLMANCAPFACALFKDTFNVAARLLERPGSTTKELLGHLCNTARQRHANNAHAIAALELPECHGSWFHTKFRHPLYVLLHTADVVDIEAYHDDEQPFLSSQGTNHSNKTDDNQEDVSSATQCHICQEPDRRESFGRRASLALKNHH